MICDAILAVSEACDSKIQSKNIHGMALAKFQLGYLLKNYKD